MRYEAQPADEVSGTMIEIEAKIGQIIDRSTGARVNLPVSTETVMVNDHRCPIQFKSSMTEHQHKHANRFLNKLYEESKTPLAASGSPQPPGPTRIPMGYTHTREKDTFYELPASEVSTLPRMLLEQLNPRHKIKVRVTTDQRTGKVLNTIIKARIADCSIFCPQSRFDWRVSVNMEMPWEGDIKSLREMGESEGPVRLKDRLSYKHLAYQVDLTQVTGNKSSKEHELEVEVSGEELRKHGRLANHSKPNAYEYIVRGFVDNVRYIVRHAAPAEAGPECGCSPGGPQMRR